MINTRRDFLILLGSSPFFIFSNSYGQKASSQEKLLLERTEGFLAARQARDSRKLRLFYHPQEIKQMHEGLKYNYVSIKNDMKKGVFSRAYIKRSIEESDFAEAYKQAFLAYLLKDANFDRALDSAFTNFIVSYSYKIVGYKINKATINNLDASVSCIEYRQAEGQTRPQPTTCHYKWKFISNNWYQSMDRPAHF